MDFSKGLKDSIDIIKNNGKLYSNIKSFFTPNVIICLGNIPIEVGDIIQRKLPTGIEEKYRVKNPCFHSSCKGYPDHYQIRYERIEDYEESKPQQNITIHGDNAKIYNNSIDKSININTNASDMENLFKSLRKELDNSNLNNKEKLEYFDIIESIEEGHKSKTMKKTAVATLLKALPPIQQITEIANNIISAWKSFE
mgnify:CR=1 FL=1